VNGDMLTATVSMAVNSTVAGAEGVAGIRMMSHPLNVDMCLRLNSEDSERI
jgi:hypothetical protein